MRLHCHLPSAYTAAAAASGLRFRSLQEPALTAEAVVTPATGVAPEAARHAFAGLPAVSIWDFERVG